MAQPKGCCSATATTGHCQIKKPSCCEVSSKYLKANFINSSQVLKTTSPALPLFFVATLFNLLPPPKVAFSPYWLAGSVPLKVAAQALTHTFRI